MASPERHLPEGASLAHYRIVRPLGRGAMGTVYLARDSGLERDVAVKVLHPEVSGDDSTVLRFQREARAAARVSHPNLAHVHFVGREDGLHFFAMELLEGRTLEAKVAEDGPLPLGEAADLLLMAARGLAAAHAAGVIHRDVKPSNLMVLPDGTLKVTDFGLAKSLTGDVEATGAGRIVGTPRYMSPEQCRGEPLDARTDVYNLGLVGWFLLTGRNPVEGDSLGQVLDDQVHRPLPSLAGPRPDLPDGVHRVLSSLTAKDRNRRVATMEEAIALLGSIRPRALDLAPLALRGAALLVDLIVFSLLAGGVEAVARRIAPGLEGTAVGEALVGLAALPCLFATQTVLEWWQGGSVGKLLFSLRVVDRSGGRAGRAALLARFVLRFPAAFAFPAPDAAAAVRLVLGAVQAAAILAAGVVYVFRRGRTLSDLLTGTRVVYLASRGRREAAGAVSRRDPR